MAKLRYQGSLYLQRRQLIAGLGGVALTAGLSRGSILSAHATAATLGTQVTAFLSRLDPEQLRVTVFPFADPERFNWHYIPHFRQGLSLKAMTSDQRQGAMDLLQFSLSEGGYQKATQIIQLETVLAQLEGSSSRDPELYYFTVFGDPQQTPWGWRVEGHHLSINFTIPDPETVIVVPSFWGSNPAEVRSGSLQGTRAQAQEQDLARELIQSLDSQQRQQAILAQQSFGDILTGPRRNQELTTPTGIPFRDLSEGHQDLAWRLIQVYAQDYRPEYAEAQLQRLRSAGLEEIHFAWAGGIEPGQAHYYRLHGPRLLIEYDNTQNQANHIHAVFRDPVEDFGADLLRAHYDQSGSDHHPA